jgi:polysaccharide deacetylase 2 family uncharacterized protein YibQ
VSESHFAKPVLYEVPIYLVGCSIENENRKTKRKKAMAKFIIELEDYELDFITDLIGSSISEFERIKGLNDAIEKRTKQEFIDNTEAQKKLFNKLNKYINGE